MDSYQILKSIHKVGHTIVGIVNGYNEPIKRNGILIGGQVILKTKSEYQVLLPYDYLFDEKKEFNEELLPKIGSRIETVIKNHVDNSLYVSARPKDLEQSTIQEYKKFYDYIENNKEGQIVVGIVKKVMPFGLFVDLGSEFTGLIDIGHSDFNNGKKLPYDNSKWPKEGDTVRCVIAYYRFHNKQIGLGWIPE
jgi:ribosomal protein S1